MSKETKNTKQRHAPYKAVKYALAGKGVTYRDVAEILDLDVSTVTEKLNGGSDFYISQIKTICETFGFEYAIFFSDNVS